MKKILLPLLLLLSLSQAAHATTWYACTSGGNWSANVWTSVSADQGTCLASLGTPIAGDTATLNSSSGNITIAGAAAAATIDETGYTGTLAFGTQTLTLTASSNIGGAMTSTSGTISVSGGTLTLLSTPTGTIPKISTTGTMTFASGGFSWPGTFNIGGNLITFSGNQNFVTFSTGTNNTASTLGSVTVTCQNLIYGAPVGTAKIWTIAAGQIWNVTNSIQISSDASNGFTQIVKSGTSSSSAFINYTGPVGNEYIAGVQFTDIDASGGTVLYDYYGSNGILTRTKNIVNITNANIAGSFLE